MFPQSTFLILAILPETLAPWMSNSTVEPRSRPKRRAASSSTDTRGRPDDPPTSHQSPRVMAFPFGRSFRNVSTYSRVKYQPCSILVGLASDLLLVQGPQSRPHERREPRVCVTALPKQTLERVALIRLEVDEEERRRVGGHVLADLPQDVLLHEMNRQDDHHADSHRDQDSLGLAPRTVQIGQSLPPRQGTPTRDSSGQPHHQPRRCVQEGQRCRQRSNKQAGGPQRSGLPEREPCQGQRQKPADRPRHSPRRSGRFIGYFPAED